MVDHEGSKLLVELSVDESLLKQDAAVKQAKTPAAKVRGPPFPRIVVHTAADAPASGQVVAGKSEFGSKCFFSFDLNRGRSVAKRYDRKFIELKLKVPLKPCRPLVVRLR